MYTWYLAAHTRSSSLETTQTLSSPSRNKVPYRCTLASTSDPWAHVRPCVRNCAYIPEGLPDSSDVIAAFSRQEGSLLGHSLPLHSWKHRHACVAVHVRPKARHTAHNNIETHSKQGCSLLVYSFSLYTLHTLL